MSFAGGGATNSGGSTSFSRSDIQGETKSFTGQTDPKVRQRRQMAMDTELQTQIKQGQLDILDKFIDETIGEPDSETQQRLNDHLDALLLVQMLEQDVQVEDADTYYSLLEDYDIEAQFDDVPDFQTVAKDMIMENFLGDINDFFDGVGKVDALEGSDAIENVGEFTSDIIEAIVDKNPKYAAIGIAELLGVEFDQDGNFNLKNTISDNAKPLMQKIMSRYVIRPIKDIFKRFGGTVEAVEEELEPLFADIIEEEAPFFEATLSEELTALAETEVLALPGIIIGGIQGTTAILSAVGGVLQAINLTHDAYTKKNHTWADQNGGFIGFVKKIPLINELAESVADLIAEAKDMRAYRRGETDRQQFEEAYAERLAQRDEQERVLSLLSNGQITYDMIENGETFTYYVSDEWGKKTVLSIDLGKYKLDDLEKRLNKDIDLLKEDGVSELNNLISFYDEETDKMLNAVPSSLRNTFSFDRNGNIVRWDSSRIRDMKKTVDSKNLGDILFAGGKKTVPISQEEFIAFVRNYNDYISATVQAKDQKAELDAM